MAGEDKVGGLLAGLRRQGVAVDEAAWRRAIDKSIPIGGTLRANRPDGDTAAEDDADAKGM